MAVNAAGFNINFEDVLPVRVYEADGGQFVWNVKRFDVLCNQMRVKRMTNSL
jgi:hypothetical protein